MRRAISILALALSAACAGGGGRVETLASASSRPLTRLGVAEVKGPEGFAGAGAARALAAALADGPFDVVAADADAGVEALIYGTVTPSAEAFELAALDARSGTVVLRVRVRPKTEVFASMREAAAAGAAALAPLAKGRRARPTVPEADELPEP